jgi:hypothetical protein
MGNFTGNPNLPLIVENSLVYSFKHAMKVVGGNILMAKKIVCVHARRAASYLSKSMSLPYDQEHVPAGGQVPETPNVP